MRVLIAFTIFIARLCLAAVFLCSSVSKVLFFDQTSQYMASKGFTMIPFFLFGAALVELIGALALIFGFKARFGSLILLLFLIPTTIIFHNFWSIDEAERPLQQIMFLKNVAIFGGLLYALCYGPGIFSFDALSNHRREKRARQQSLSNTNATLNNDQKIG